MDIPQAEMGLIPIFISVKQAAQMLGISSWTCYQLLDQQAIESRYQGRRRLVDVESLKKYAKGLPKHPEVSAS